MSFLNCRYYSNTLPEVDSVVMVNVRQISEMGVYVKLLEYDSIDGMILLSELSRRRIRSLQKLIRIGKNEAVVVLRVDKEKGYIDLSKRRVTPEDIIKCEEKFQKGKMAHSILRHVAEKCKIPILNLYETIGWPLAKKYGSATDAFKISITHPHVWDEAVFCTPEVKTELEHYIARRLTPHPIKLRADIEVQCFGYLGIEAIRTALKAGEALATEVVPIKIKLVAPPLYVLNSLQCFDREEGLATLSRAINAIRESIEKVDGGYLRVVMEPKAISVKDEEALKDLMERKERENMEVSGDEDVEMEVDEESDIDPDPVEISVRGERGERLKPERYH